MNIKNRRNRIDFPVIENQNIPEYSKSKLVGKYPTKAFADVPNIIHIGIIVPSTVNIKLKNGEQKKIKPQKFKERIQETIRFLNRFGGTTTYSGKGSYTMSKTGKVVKEQVAVVETYAEIRAYRKYDIDVYNWLKRKCKKENWHQETIGFTFNGKFFMVKE